MPPKPSILSRAFKDDIALALGRWQGKRSLNYTWTWTKTWNSSSLLAFSWDSLEHVQKARCPDMRNHAQDVRQSCNKHGIKKEVYSETICWPTWLLSIYMFERICWWDLSTRLGTVCWPTIGGGVMSRAAAIFADCLGRFAAGVTESSGSACRLSFAQPGHDGMEG